MDNATLEPEIRSIRRELRLLRVACLLAVTACVGLVLMGQTSPAPEQIVARRFVLEDDDGRERARLFIDGDGSGSLRFYDQAGTERLTIVGGAEKGSTWIRMYDAEGVSRAQLHARPGTEENRGGSGFSLNGYRGKARCALSISDWGEAALRLSDSMESGQAELEVRRGGGYVRVTRGDQFRIVRPGRVITSE